MTTVMTPEEFAAETGCDLDALRASIREAEADAITRDTLDASTLRTHNVTPATEERMRRFLELAKDPTTRLGNDS